MTEQLSRLLLADVAAIRAAFPEAVAEIERRAVKPVADRLRAVHKSGACGGSYSDAERRWCDCGYLTLGLDDA